MMVEGSGTPAWRFWIDRGGTFTDLVARRPGGAGAHAGGDGAVRRMRFREKMTASIPSGHRRIPAYGMESGAPGAIGRNYVERTDGSVDVLSGTDSTEMAPGDVFVIETPGGGGMAARRGRVCGRHFGRTYTGRDDAR